LYFIFKQINVAREPDPQASFVQQETIMKCLFCRLISRGLCHKQTNFVTKSNLEIEEARALALRFTCFQCAKRALRPEYYYYINI